MSVPVDGCRIYLAHQGIRVFDNALTAPADTPDFVLTPAGPGTPVGQTTACWLDDQRNIIYGAFMGDQSTWIWAWNNASQLTANREADFGYKVMTGRQPGAMVGGVTHDVLFLARWDVVWVIDNPRGRTGTINPDRTILDSKPGTDAVAYDDTRDILYTFRQDTSAFRYHTIRAIPTASQADGEPASREFGGQPTDIGGPRDNVYGLQAFGDDDVLFVANQEHDVLAFAGASALEGDVAQTARYRPDHLLQNFAVYRVQ